MFAVASCAIGDFDPFGYFFSSRFTAYGQARSVVVSGNELDDPCENCAGVCRVQLMLMKEKSRCRFYPLTVRGGKWHTVIGNFSSSAQFLDSIFTQTDAIAIRLPPPSAVTNTTPWFRITFLSHGLHQRRMALNRKGGVS